MCSITVSSNGHRIRLRVVSVPTDSLIETEIDLEVLWAKDRVNPEDPVLTDRNSVAFTGEDSLDVCRFGIDSSGRCYYDRLRPDKAI